MGNNRGVGCKKLCPTCHVPEDELHDCGEAWWPLRTGTKTQQIIDQSWELTATEGEALLKKNGLRPIDVC